jgi:WD40 repeat protein
MRVAIAFSLCLIAAALPWTLRLRTADSETGPPPSLQVLAIPSTLAGAKVTAAALRRDGLLALGTAQGRVVIVDRTLRGWRGGWERSAGPAAIAGLAFSPDGVAMAGVIAKSVLVWRLDDQTVATLPGSEEPPSAMALGPGGRRLAVANLEVSVLDVADQHLVRRFEQEMQDEGNDVYDALAFSPDGGIIAAAGVNTTDTWNLDTGRKLQHWSCQCDAAGVSFSRDATLAAVGTTEAHLLLWDVAAAKRVKEKTISALAGDHVYGTAINLKGTLVAAGTASGEVVVWDTTSGAIIGRTSLSGQPVSRITATDDGQLLLVEVQKLEYERWNYDRWLVTVPGR